MVTVPAPSQGEIWIVNFDPAVGSEIRKLRPAVVIGRNSIGRLPLRLVVPITDWKTRYSAYPWIVPLRPTPANGLIKESGADAFQTKSISISRFTRRMGALTRAEAEAISNAILLCVRVP